MDVNVIATWQIQNRFPRLPIACAAPRRQGAAYRPGQRKTLHLSPAWRRLSIRRFRQADVVNIHALWEQIQHDVGRAAIRRRVPYVITPHGMPRSPEPGARIARQSLGETPLPRNKVATKS